MKQINKNKKKKKNVKVRLSALLLLLLLTVVMLTTSTYAWFTANRTVTIDDITVNVSTQSGLQISTDAVYWKTLIANSDITAPAGWSDHTNQFPPTLVPVSTAGDINTQGKINMYTGNVGTDLQGQFTVSSVVANEAKGVIGNFVAFDIFLNAEAGGQIYLTKNAGVSIVGETNSGLQNAARVAFVNEGTVSTNSASTVMQALFVDSGTATIWEPNYDSHTQAGINNANAYYAEKVAASKVAAGSATDLTAGTDNFKLQYDGIAAAFTEGVKFTDAIAPTPLVGDGTDKFKPVTTTETLATPATGTAIFTLQPGVTKLRVYLWVEGQDVDCENNASGHSITYNIVLSLDNE